MLFEEKIEKVLILIKLYIKRKGITYANLSKMTEIPSQTLYNMLNGKQRLTVEAVLKIADVLEVEISYFFGDSPTDEKADYSEIIKTMRDDYRRFLNIAVNKLVDANEYIEKYETLLSKIGELYLPQSEEGNKFKDLLMLLSDINFRYNSLIKIYADNGQFIEIDPEEYPERIDLLVDTSLPDGYKKDENL